MQGGRLAAVFAVDSRKKSKTSTGYVIAARLVLTAAHAAGPADKAEVQLSDQASPVPCTVLWNGRADDLDAALLEVDRQTGRLMLRQSQYGLGGWSRCNRIARRVTDRALKEDEEIRRRAVEITTVKKIDTDELWSTAAQILEGYGLTLEDGPKEGNRPTLRWRDRLRAARLECWRTLRGLFLVHRWRRALADGFRKKGKGGIIAAEDPRETLDHSYELLAEKLTRLRYSVAEIAVKRKQTELRMGTITKGRVPDSDDQIAQLERDYELLSEVEEKLTTVSQEFEIRTNGFRSQKETLKATYTAAEAKSRIDRAFSEIVHEREEFGLKTRRAQDRTTYMQMRLDSDREVAATGAADNAPPPGRREMRTAEEGLSADIVAELELLKNEIGGDSHRPEGSGLS
jgi:phage shock protein A